MDEREEYHRCYDEDDAPSPKLIVWVVVFAAMTLIGVAAVIAGRVS